MKNVSAKNSERNHTITGEYGFTFLTRSPEMVLGYYVYTYVGVKEESVSREFYNPKLSRWFQIYHVRSIYFFTIYCGL